MMPRLARLWIATGFALALVVSSGPPALAQGGADLSVSVTGPSRVKSTSISQFTITVLNAGPETAAGIFIGGSAGDQFQPVAVTCNDNGDTTSYGCTPNDLAAGASVTATLTLRVCCFFRGETRTSPVNGNVESANDPNYLNDAVQKIVYITGPYQK